MFLSINNALYAVENYYFLTKIAQNVLFHDIGPLKLPKRGTEILRETKTAQDKQLSLTFHLLLRS